MRKHGRKDANQDEIIGGLRAIGCTVQTLADVGGGCPDILVGYRARNFLIEIKDGAKPPSKRKLTPDQKSWHSNWRGQVRVVASLEEAITLVSNSY